MKKDRKRWIFAVAIIVCLLVTVLILGTSGGGTLQKTTEQQLVIGGPHRELSFYDVHAGCKVSGLTIVAATPWGILIRCSVPEHYLVKWYQGDSSEYETTEEAVTKWKFLVPGEEFRIYVRQMYTLDENDGTYATYTYTKD